MSELENLITEYAAPPKRDNELFISIPSVHVNNTEGPIDELNNLLFGTSTKPKRRLTCWEPTIPTISMTSKLLSPSSLPELSEPLSPKSDVSSISVVSSVSSAMTWKDERRQTMATIIDPYFGLLDDFETIKESNSPRLSTASSQSSECMAVRIRLHEQMFRIKIDMNTTLASLRVCIGEKIEFVTGVDVVDLLDGCDLSYFKRGREKNEKNRVSLFDEEDWETAKREGKWRIKIEIDSFKNL
jgi:hypothetical protein